jgi:hypothetical protein
VTKTVDVDSPAHEAELRVDVDRLRGFVVWLYNCGIRSLDVDLEKIEEFNSFLEETREPRFSKSA